MIILYKKRRVREDALLDALFANAHSSSFHKSSSSYFAHCIRHRSGPFPPIFRICYRVISRLMRLHLVGPWFSYRFIPQKTITLLPVVDKKATFHSLMSLFNFLMASFSEIYCAYSLFIVPCRFG